LKNNLNYVKMVNRRYRKGYRFEHRVKKYLERFGYKVFRLAGSKPIDLIAIKVGGEAIYYIECKSTNYVKRAGKKLLRVTSGLPGRAIVAYRDIRNRIRFYDPVMEREVSIPPSKELDKYQ